MVCLGSLKFLFSLSSQGKARARVNQCCLMENVAQPRNGRRSIPQEKWIDGSQLNVRNALSYITFSMEEQRHKLASTAVFLDRLLIIEIFAASKSYPKMLSDESVWHLHQEAWILFTFKSRMQPAFLISLCIFDKSILYP